MQNTDTLGMLTQEGQAESAVYLHRAADDFCVSS